jgi:hypothetical protein
MGKPQHSNKTITVITGGRPGAGLILAPLTTARTERRKLERKLKKNK